jgi:hypothetical protein
MIRTRKSSLASRALQALFLLALPCCLAPAAEPPNAEAIQFNRAWWSQTSPDEQQAFISGYLDCRHHATTNTAVLGQFQRFIAGRKGDGSKFVPAAIEAGERRIKASVDPNALHDQAQALNGEYWGTVNPHPNYLIVRRGFVEGFLSCSVKQVTPSQVQSDIQQLDSYYAGELHHGDRIADVLHVIEQQQRQ